MNIIKLSATGSSGPNIDFMEINAVNGDHSVSSRGTVHITADNGYILYVNGDRIAAGGAALPVDDPYYDKDGWIKTDVYTVRALPGCLSALIILHRKLVLHGALSMGVQGA